jgi:hypothetical protein
LLYEPLLALARDKLVQRVAVALTARRQARVAPDGAPFIVLALAVARDPDLPRCQVERLQVRAYAGGEEASEAVVNYLASDIDELGCECQ